MPKRKTQEEFIQEAQVKHNGFYNYSQVIYKNSNTKVTVVCPNHGEFEIDPGHHINGVGCRKCSFERLRNSQDDIIARFRETHGDRYKYDKVVYAGSNHKVTVGCPIHGDFQQTVSAHIKGSGCTKCAIENQTLTTQEFISQAIVKHGDKYDYSQATYVNTQTKVTIICLQHGSFEQSAGNHLKGNRCPKCAKEYTTKKQFGFEYRGNHYRSIKHACQELGKDYWVVLKRLDADWTLEEAFDEKPHRPRHPFKVNGIIYNGIEDAVRQLNAPVSSTTVARRIKEGMAPEEALFTLPKLGYDNGIIYLITNLINNKQYIGLTTTSLEERWERHLYQVLRKEASLLHKAIAEFGKESFSIEIVDSASDIKQLQAKERQWIKELKTLAPYGYNVTLGGEIGGSPGKPTRLPGDPILYPTVKAAAEALAEREGINAEAAEKRIYDARKTRGIISKSIKHGMSKTPIYKYWDYLVHSSTNPNSKDYRDCDVCNRWRDFKNFYEDVIGDWAPGFYLKLIDPSLPYSKDNCVWVDKKELYQTHGMTGTRFYKIWARLKNFYTNPASKIYKKGILCEQWKEFENFKADMYDSYEEGMNLMLIDKSHPYSKHNCVWVEKKRLYQTHGMTGTRFHNIWGDIKFHRTNPTSKSYTGAALCERWKEFENFKADMHDSYKEGMGLMLIDKNYPYSRDNCMWAFCRNSPVSPKSSQSANLPKQLSLFEV